MSDKTSLTSEPASGPVQASSPTYLRSVLKVLGGSATAQAIPILMMLLLTRLVSVDILGVFAIWQSVIYIALVLATARMDILLVSLPHPADRLLAFRIGMSSSLLVGGLLSLLAATATGFIQTKLPGWDLSASLLLGLGVCALAMQTLWLARAIATGAFGTLNRIRITSAGLTALLQMVLLWYHPSAMMLMLGFVIGTSCGSLAGWSSLTRRQDGSQPDAPPHDASLSAPATDYRDLLRQHGRTPMIALPAALINTIAQQIPLMLTGVRFGEEAAGFLGIAWRTISAPMSIISNSALDVFKKSATDEYNETGQCRSAYLQTLRLLAFLAIFPSLILFIWGPSLFAIAFGEQYRTAGEITQIFAPLLYLRFFASPLGYTFLIVRRPKVELWWQIGLLFMSLAVFVIPQTAMTAFKAFSAGYASMYVIYLILQWQAANARR
ncbi:MAG: oligosaccharide flippase family protein [Lautropia sp.]|nr:oligosaccharide flippase family protein [Lautropia sp.]